MGSRFRVERPGEAATDLRLAEVRPLAAPGDHAGAENAFALRFSGPTAALPQDTYMLRHRRLGTFALFVVPMSASGSRREYEAIVNRQVPRA